MPDQPPWEVPHDTVVAEAPGAFITACRDNSDALVYLLLNVGDGDTQVLLLPERKRGGGRCAVVVDVATRRKLPGVLEQLEAAQVLAAASSAQPTFPVVVGTHPHGDHIGGMPEFLGRYGRRVGEYWEPGYYHPSTSFIETMVCLEDAHDIGHLQPTSGTSRYIGSVKLTVLTPGVGLRNRFDSYGTDINNSSISLKVEFPAARVTTRRDEADERSENRVYLRLNDPWSLILGADTQTTGWAQAEVDFPELHRGHDPTLYKELRAASGRDHLRGHIFKLPHHASKHGVNLELVERIKPWIALVSSVGGGGKYQFPHALALDATREALRPTSSGRRSQLPDHRLGIHHAGAVSVGADGVRRPLGSMAILIPPGRGGTLQMWRFGDGPRERVDLDRAWKVKKVRDLNEPEVDLREPDDAGGEPAVGIQPSAGATP